jgi:signal transduction histidine kinase
VVRGPNHVFELTNGQYQRLIGFRDVNGAAKFTDEGRNHHGVVGAVGGLRGLSVRDTGVGIHASKLAAIFEPFVQVDTHLTRRHDGIGLGLAISRDLARGMRGDLVAESTVGVGSVPAGAACTRIVASIVRLDLRCHPALCSG